MRNCPKCGSEYKKSITFEHGEKAGEYLNTQYKVACPKCEIMMIMSIPESFVKELRRFHTYAER
jgi:uncharacterized C2H2 Zn-finger protein